jgi:hypothetical protein
MMKNLMICFLCAISVQAVGQISRPISPRSNSLSFEEIQALANVNYVDLPVLDNEDESSAAARVRTNECVTCPNNYFAKTVDFTVNLKSSGTKVELEDGYIWILELRSSNAKNLHFFFKDFYIPQGATLHIYNLNRSFVMADLQRPSSLSTPRLLNTMNQNPLLFQAPSSLINLLTDSRTLLFR